MAHHRTTPICEVDARPGGIVPALASERIAPPSGTSARKGGRGTPGRWSRLLFLAGIAAAMTGRLTRLAIAGFDRGGALPALALAAFGGGVACTLLSGRSPPAILAG
jgi:hypothetical protein